MKTRIVLSFILALAATGAMAQDRLIRVIEHPESWKKRPQAVFYDSEKTRLLMPQGATFGVECIPSFTPEWTLTYDSLSCSLVYKEAQKSLWHATWTAWRKPKGKSGRKKPAWRKHPKDYEAPDVSTFKCAITSEQTAMLQAIWTSAVESAEDREDGMLDGVTWMYFINGQRAKGRSDKLPFVKFTNELANAVRNGNASRTDSLIGNEFQRIVAGLKIESSLE